jgi:hypothetical protein
MEIVSSELVKDLGSILLKREVWRHEGNPDTPIEAAYSAKDGGYVGEWKDARWLHEKGIAPEIRPGSCGSVCSIGFCDREQKWYGWSHRALYGFGIGDVVEKGSCCASSGWTDEYLAEHPEADESLPVGFKAETLDDAKRMAEAFAEGVG